MTIISFVIICSVGVCALSIFDAFRPRGNLIVCVTSEEDASQNFTFSMKVELPVSVYYVRNDLQKILRGLKEDDPTRYKWLDPESIEFSLKWREYSEFTAQVASRLNTGKSFDVVSVTKNFIPAKSGS